MSQLKARILDEVKVAMKARQSERLGVLRMIHAAFKDLEIAQRPETPSETDYVKVLKKMKKQRLESLQMYQSAGRENLAEKESREVDVLGEFMPKLLSQEQVETVVEQVISEIKPSGMKDMGLVMKKVAELTAGSADAQMVSQIVKTRLQ